MNRCAFVAGGGGFLGHYAISALVESGYKVISIGLGAPAAVAGATAHYEGLISRELFATAMTDHGAPDVLIHAAGGASVGRSWADPKGDFDLSVGSMSEVLDFLRHEATETRLVFVSSAAVYGGSGGEMLKESDPCAPVSPYGVHKAASEELVLGEVRMRGLSAVIIRFFSLYGEGLRKQILWDVMQRANDGSENPLQLWGSGIETRDFLHAKDAGKIIAGAANLAPTNPLIMNGASGRAITIKQLIERLLVAAGVEREIAFNGKTRAGDPLHLTADLAILQSELAIQLTTDLDSDLANYVAWFNFVNQSVAPR